MRLHAFGVVDMQICPCATLLTFHAVTHLGPEFPFDDFERFAAIAAASLNCRRVDALVWAGCSLWMVVRHRCVAGQVGMRESRLALLPVALAVKLLSDGEPLVRFQRVTAFAHLCVPTGSAVEPSGLFTDELPFVAALVLLPQPVEVTEPREARDVLDVLHKAGVPVVFGPTPHDSVQGGQSGMLVHPSPVSGCQVFELPFHSLLIALFIWFVFLTGKLYGTQRAQGVRITPEQFPEVYNMWHTMALGVRMKRVSELYTVNGNGVLNAFAAGVPGFRYFSTINSDILEACLRNQDWESLKFMLGHELGRMKLGHVTWW